MKILVLLLVSILSLFAGNKELYVYNWSEYMPPSILKNFTRDTGIKIHYSTYDSNEEMYEKLKSSDALDSLDYDIVFPSTYFVSKMAKEGLLFNIDKTKLSNFKNLNSRLLSKSFDRKNNYSVPYLWGTTGIIYNTAAVYSDINSWLNLWEKRYKKSILLNDDMREVFGIAFKVLGYSANTTDPKKIEEAYHKLLELKPNIKVYDSELQKNYYLNNIVKLGMSFNGEGFMAKKEDDVDKFSKMIFDGDLDSDESNKNLLYIYPLEGVIIWMDSLVIAKSSKNVDNAHIFINYLLIASVGKEISQDLGYASPNRASMKLLNRATRKNRTIYPNRKDLRNAEFIIDIGDTLAIYEKYWKMLKEE
ncbi:MAG: extracellular solute-binding protein [Sulfurovum sp.]